jgi:hypothetical protein
MKTKLIKILSLQLIFFFFCLNPFFADSLNNIDELTSVWKSNNYTVTYPFHINENNYFMVEYTKIDITNEWYDICESRGLNFEESLIIKDVIISKIYDKDYPLANGLGVNEGIRISYNDKLKKPKIKAQRIMLIPEEVISYCLEYFDLTGNRLQMTAPIFFPNSQIENFYIEDRLRRKGVF